MSHNERVCRELRGAVLNGAVLALPFSDGYAAAVTDAVLNTGLHRTPDEHVKFAVAAHVEPLGTAWMCCIWLYIAAVREAC
jgi:coiled-coil and C2 domain-containing protein 2A